MTPSHDAPAPLALCVADANILFDLRNSRILSRLAALSYRFIVPDAVLEELYAPLRSTVKGMGFESGSLGAEAVGEIVLLKREYLFALFLA